MTVFVPLKRYHIFPPPATCRLWIYPQDPMDSYATAGVHSLFAIGGRLINFFHSRSLVIQIDYFFVQSKVENFSEINSLNAKLSVFYQN